MIGNRGGSDDDRAPILSSLGPGLAEHGNESRAQALTELAAEQGRSNGLHLDAPAIEAGLVEQYIANSARSETGAVRGVPFARWTRARSRSASRADRERNCGRYRARLAETPDLRLRNENRGARPGQVFFDWRMTGSMAGRPFELGAAERLTLQGGRIAESVSYFDTLSLHALRDPSIMQQTIFDRPK